MKRWLFILTLASGCATTTSHLQAPHALEPKQAEVSGVYSAQLNGVVLDKSLSSAKTLYEQATEDGRELSEEEFREFLDTSLAWSLLTPGTSYEFIGRLGLSDAPLEGMDVGLRTDFSIIKADLKWQLWESEDGHQAVAWSLAYARHGSLVSRPIEILSNSSFSRHDLDTALIWGARKPGVFDLYGGPRLIYSIVDVDTKLPSALKEQLPESIQALDPSEYFSDERMIYTGTTLGSRLGLHAVFLSLELNLFWVQFQPQVIDQIRTMNGLLVSPAIGLTLLPSEFPKLKEALRAKREK